MCVCVWNVAHFLAFTLGSFCALGMHLLDVILCVFTCLPLSIFSINCAVKTTKHLRTWNRETIRT